jgi:alkylhydroperoxidase/carboxymuconolactone decarboxylase family protein YurZ
MAAQEFPGGLSTSGNAFGVLVDMNLDAAESFARVRAEFFADRSDGMPGKYKELLMVVMEIFGRHRPGAKRHLNLARELGLTETELRECLTLIYLMRGMSEWADMCHELWTHWTAGPDPETT